MILTLRKDKMKGGGVGLNCDDMWSKRGWTLKRILENKELSEMWFCKHFENWLERKESQRRPHSSAQDKKTILK